MPQTVVAVPEIAKRGYAHPEVLVSTQWVEEHRTDPKVRIVESNEDILLYETGHIPGAVKVDWVTDLNDPLVGDVRLLGLHAVRRRAAQGDGRRPAALGGGGPRAGHRGAQVSRGQHHRGGTRRFPDPRVPRRGGAARAASRAAGRRAQSRGVPRRAAAHARVSE